MNCLESEVFEQKQNLIWTLVSAVAFGVARANFLSWIEINQIFSISPFKGDPSFEPAGVKLTGRCPVTATQRLFGE